MVILRMGQTENLTEMRESSNATDEINQGEIT